LYFDDAFETISKDASEGREKWRGNPFEKMVFLSISPGLPSLS